MKNLVRLLANLLLPIGCGLILILFDHVFHSFIINLYFTFFIVFISSIRIFASYTEHAKYHTVSLKKLNSI